MVRHCTCSCSSLLCSYFPYSIAILEITFLSFLCSKILTTCLTTLSTHFLSLWTPPLWKSIRRSLVNRAVPRWNSLWHLPVSVHWFQNGTYSATLLSFPIFSECKNISHSLESCHSKMQSRPFACLYCRKDIEFRIRVICTCREYDLEIRWFFLLFDARPIRIFSQSLSSVFSFDCVRFLYKIQEVFLCSNNLLYTIRLDLLRTCLFSAKVQISTQWLPEC
jgi:hypothetical protein